MNPVFSLLGKIIATPSPFPCPPGIKKLFPSPLQSHGSRLRAFFFDVSFSPQQDIKDPFFLVNEGDSPPLWPSLFLFCGRSVFLLPSVCKEGESFRFFSPPLSGLGIELASFFCFPSFQVYFSPPFRGVGLTFLINGLGEVRPSLFSPPIASGAFPFFLFPPRSWKHLSPPLLLFSVPRAFGEKQFPFRKTIDYGAPLGLPPPSS